MTRLLFTLLAATFALTAVTVVTEKGDRESRAHSAVARDHTGPGESVATSSPREPGASKRRPEHGGEAENRRGADPEFGRALGPPQREPAQHSNDAVLIAS